MNSIKYKITESITNHVNTLFEEIHEAESVLSNINKDIRKSGDEYIEVKRQTDELKVKVKEFNQYLEKEKQNIDNSKEDIKGALDCLSKEKAVHRTELQKTIKSIQIKKQELEEIQDRIKSTETLKKVKDQIENEITKLKSILSDQEEKNSKILEDSTNDLKDIQDQINTKDKELLELDKDIANRRAVVLPKFEELNKKETQLKEKEYSLNIIEARFKKMYGEHNTGFKV